jgi:hypothetical protein
MSVNFYLAGRKHHRVFELGSHKLPFRLHELVWKAMADPYLRGVGFVSACATICRGLMRPALGAEEIESWVRDARKNAKEVLAFCEEEEWQVDAVAESDDDLFKKAGDGQKLWKKTHSVYTDSYTCELCHNCGEEPVSVNGLCRDCDIDEHLESMRCPDCGNVVAREGIEIPEIAALVLDLGWVHKDDCQRRHS